MEAPPGIPKSLQAEVELQLVSREQIRWIEQPVPRFFTAKSTTDVFCGILVTAWTVHEISALRPHLTFDLICLALCILLGIWGIIMILSPLWTYRRARRTLYVITDRRAIVFEPDKPGWITTVTSYWPDRLKNMKRRERKDGTGDVVLGRVFGPVLWWRKVGFFRVRDVRKTEQVLRELMGLSNLP